MKVVGIKHLLKRGHSLTSYTNKFEEAMADGTFFLDGIDLALGPDYALYFYQKRTNKIDFSEVDKAVEFFRALSAVYPETSIIPGTMPYKIKDKLFHVAPIFINGQLDDMLLKESDCGEARLAKANGLEYKKGDSSENYVYVNGKKVAVEICSDFGKQRVSKDTFLEAILAFDNLGGFSIRADNDDFSRYGLICNSVKRAGTNGSNKVIPVDCSQYSLDNFPKQRVVEPSYETKDSCGYILT